MPRKRMYVLETTTNWEHTYQRSTQLCAKAGMHMHTHTHIEFEPCIYEIELTITIPF